MQLDFARYCGTVAATLLIMSPCPAAGINANAAYGAQETKKATIMTRTSFDVSILPFSAVTARPDDAPHAVCA